MKNIIDWKFFDDEKRDKLMRVFSLLKRFILIFFCFFICLLCGGWLLEVILYDGLGGLIFGDMLNDDTSAYTTGYSEQAFKTIRVGMHEREVLDILGKPVFEGWYYETPDKQRLYNIWFTADEVTKYQEKEASVQKGMNKEQVKELIGEPPRRGWCYSWSPLSGDYRVRFLAFERKIVTEITHEYYID